MNCARQSSSLCFVHHFQSLFHRSVFVLHFTRSSVGALALPPLASADWPQLVASRLVIGGRVLPRFDVQRHSLRYTSLEPFHSLRLRAPLHYALSAFGSLVAPLTPPAQLTPLCYVAFRSGCYNWTLIRCVGRRQGSASALF